MIEEIGREKRRERKSQKTNLFGFRDRFRM